MNSEELNKIFNALNEANQLKLSDFPYAIVRKKLDSNLKKYLKEKFGNDIEFDDGDTYAYFHGYYKGIGIEINTFKGLILTIEDKKMGYLANDFKEVLSSVVGMNPICSYDYCFQSNDKEFTYPTVEWSLDPEKRLYELIVEECSKINNLEDYYTSSIIESLGDDLFTLDGFRKIFKNGYDNSNLIIHKIDQIKKLNKFIDIGFITIWFNSSRKAVDVIDTKIYQKRVV